MMDKNKQDIIIGVVTRVCRANIFEIEIDEVDEENSKTYRGKLRVRLVDVPFFCRFLRTDKRLRRALTNSILDKRVRVELQGQDEKGRWLSEIDGLSLMPK